MGRRIIQFNHTVCAGKIIGASLIAESENQLFFRDRKADMKMKGMFQLCIMLNGIDRKFFKT